MQIDLFSYVTRIGDKLFAKSNGKLIYTRRAAWLVSNITLCPKSEIACVPQRVRTKINAVFVKALIQTRDLHNTFVRWQCFVQISITHKTRANWQNRFVSRWTSMHMKYTSKIEYLSQYCIVCSRWKKFLFHSLSNILNSYFYTIEIKCRTE